MRKFRLVAPLVVLCALALGACSSGSSESPVVGTWEGNDAVIVFSEDETFTFTSGNIVSEGTYTATESEIVYTFTVNNSPACIGKSITWSYEVDGDSMTAETIADECTTAVGARWGLARTGDG